MDTSGRVRRGVTDDSRNELGRKRLLGVFGQWGLYRLIILLVYMIQGCIWYRIIRVGKPSMPMNQWWLMNWSKISKAEWTGNHGLYHLFFYGGVSYDSESPGGNFTTVALWWWWRRRGGPGDEDDDGGWAIAILMMRTMIMIQDSYEYIRVYNHVVYSIPVKLIFFDHFWIFLVMLNTFIPRPPRSPSTSTAPPQVGKESLWRSKAWMDPPLSFRLAMMQPSKMSTNTPLRKLVWNQARNCYWLLAALSWIIPDRCCSKWRVGKLVSLSKESVWMTSQNTFGTQSKLKPKKVWLLKM